MGCSKGHPSGLQSSLGASLSEAGQLSNTEEMLTTVYSTERKAFLSSRSLSGCPSVLSKLTEPSFLDNGMAEAINPTLY